MQSLTESPAANDPNQTRLEIQKLNSLPAMSLVVQQFLLAVQDSDLEVRQLAAIIEQDPGLLGRIIGLANSAYFAYPERVVTAEDAVFKVLGLNTAKSIALSLILAGPFDARRCRAFHLDAYWAHAMSVAILAKRLAPFVGNDPKPTPGDAYLAGLLHSIGLLALVHLFPQPMQQVFATGASSEPLQLLEGERTLVGTDHCDVGSWLARKWRLPAATVAVIEHHALPELGGEHRTLVTLIHHAAAWVGAQASTEPAPLPDFSQIGIAPEHARRVCDSLAEKRAEILMLARTLAHG